MEIGHQGEGTGTRPDYLVNRVLTKNEGQHPEKFVRKSLKRDPKIVRSRQAKC